MSNYKDNYGLYTVGVPAEERYSYDRYYCPRCNHVYRTYFTFTIPGHFINTPERWSCPNGCVYSSFQQRKPIPTELRGKCCIHRKGKNCFVKYTYVPHLEPNLTHSDLEKTPYGNSIGIRNGPQGTNNNIAGTAHDILLEKELFAPHFNIALDYSNQYPIDPRQSHSHHRLHPQSYHHSHVHHNIPIFAGNNFYDGNYHGYMRSIDWNRRLKQVHPNPLNIWAK